MIYSREIIIQILDFNKRQMKIRIVVFLLFAIVASSNTSTSAEINHLNTEQLQTIKPQVYNIEPAKTSNNSKEQQSSTHDNKSQTQQEHSGQQQEEHHYISPSSPQFIQTVALSIFLAICGAFCSGMGVGLLSISKLELQMMLNKQNEQEVKVAKMILRVVSQHHLFLVTLLIANAMALETLPLIIHLMMPDWLAIIFSTFIVLVAAEIIPQAVCTGPNKIKIAYYASPIILVMIKIFWIIAYPTAKFLDYLVGDHHDEKIQHKDFATFLNDDKFLKKTQKQLLTSTLELRGERVKNVMIPVDQFYMLEENQLITEAIAEKIYKKDYSYVLVYKQSKSNITGIIKVKEFAIFYLKQKNKSDIIACTVMKRNAKMLTVYEDTNLLEMLMLFQAKSTRVALVCNIRRKVDPNIKSIMYSKSDMIYSSAPGQSGVEVIGVVFLYHILNNMAELKQKIQRQSQFIMNRMQQPQEQEMTTLKKPLLK